MNDLQSEHINELISALSKAQGEITPALKDCSNPFFKSKYADLHSVWNACREPLSKNGLAVVQSITNQDGKVILVTTLGHSSGQWMKSFLPIISEKSDAQSYGKAITYMRRYSLASMVGVAPNDDSDDDGNTACSESLKRKGYSDNQPIIQPPRTITSDQAVEIHRLTGHDETFQKNMMKYYQVEKISDLPLEKWSEIFKASKKKYDTDSKSNVAGEVKEESIV